jgi:hypothetical protein
LSRKQCGQQKHHCHDGPSVSHIHAKLFRFSVKRGNVKRNLKRWQSVTGAVLMTYKFSIFPSRLQHQSRQPTKIHTSE